MPSRSITSLRPNVVQMSAPRSTNIPNGNKASSNVLKPLPTTNEQQNMDSTNDDDENDCGICCEKPIDAVVYKCGHSCMCFECAGKLKNTTSSCPICRAPIDDVIRLYKS